MLINKRVGEVKFNEKLFFKLLYICSVRNVLFPKIVFFEKKKLEMVHFIQNDYILFTRGFYILKFHEYLIIVIQNIYV